MSVSKTGKPPSFSTIPISFHMLTVLENDAAKRENMRDPRNTSSANQLSKIPSMVQSNTSPSVMTDCDTSENCPVTLFTKGGAVPLLM